MSEVNKIETSQVPQEPKKRAPSRKNSHVTTKVEAPTTDRTIILGRQETWSKLARRYGVAKETLMSKNGGGPLYAGRIIRI